jgi:hypothetical protein
MAHLNPRHPVIRQEYAVFTPPMNDMIDTIGDWIDRRVSGGYIYGPSRFGKSRTVKWHLKTVLEERFKTVLPLVVWSRRDSAMTEAEFWNALLGAAKFEFYDALKPKRRQIAKFLFQQRLVTLASQARGNYVVLMIDEAHDVTLKEWKWLLGLQNELDDQGIRMSVFSVGSHGLTFQPDYFARTGDGHITARFFACDKRFHGIASPDELGYVMGGYDVDSEWPKNSGVSYLQYFAPDEFAIGMRLEHCKDAIWMAFDELTPQTVKLNKKIPFEIPMQHLSHATERMLHRLASGEAWDQVTNYKSWLETISKTGFSNYMRVISASGGG